MKKEKHIKPPKWADDFLTWICAPRYIDEIQGDLYEGFHRRCAKRGPHRARVLFVMEVFRSISFETIDRSLIPSFTSKLMLGNYLKSGWRNFVKYKSYSLINLFGLSLGFCSALLLYLIVRYENSFDDFHKNRAQVYRVGNKFSSGGYDDRVVVPQVPLMDQEYVDIVASSRFFPQSDIMSIDQKFVRTGYTFVDPGFADIFDFKVIHGDIKRALSAPGQIVLTEKAAAGLFGDGNPMGKTVSLINEKSQYVVAAVVIDPPSNSTIQFEALVPWSSAPKWLEIDQVGNWYNTFMEAYVLIDPRTSKDDLEIKLVEFVNAHFLEDRKASWRVLLLPMEDEHFRLTGNKQTIAILAIMGSAILLISCINFANLSIAQTLRRTREIGVRRVLGSLKQQVAVQFVSESAIAFALSLFLGFSMAYFAIPFVNTFYDFNISIGLSSVKSLLFFLGGACLLLILCSTFGTATALTNVKPVNALKGIFGGAGRGESLRRVLLTVQITTSVILLAGTIVVWQQTDYMKSQDLKFSGSNVVIVDMWSELFRDSEKARQRLSTIRDELKRESAIKSVSFTSSSPGEYNENYNGFQPVDVGSSDKWVSLRQLSIGEGYFETMRIPLAMGRDFSEDIQSDSTAVILNETAMRELGWNDLNNRVLLEGGGGNVRLHVIGVVKDYFYQSLKQPIQPLIHTYSPEVKQRLAVQFRPGQVQDGLKILEKKWQQLDAFEAFNYRFVDKTFESLYKEQERLGAASSLFSAVAIVIACLGLLSIMAYSIRLRRKEVGIRKVLGATVRSVMFSLSRQYVLIAVIGFLLACPIVYFLMTAFLHDFAYRITLSPFVFIISGVVVFMLSFMVVCAIAGQAASENPVQALKEDS